MPPPVNPRNAHRGRTSPTGATTNDEKTDGRNDPGAILQQDLTFRAHCPAGRPCSRAPQRPNHQYRLKQQSDTASQV